ncbi:MAG TPA: hypothetical protein VIY86_00030 [Pirellulaceae bacterium]
MARISGNLENIDDLVASIAAANRPSAHDLTGDGFVNLTDRNRWFALAGRANLPTGPPDR